MAIAVQPFEGTYKLDPNHSSFQFSVTAPRSLDVPRVVR